MWKNPFLVENKSFFEDFYLVRKWEYLYELEQHLTMGISRRFLGIKTGHTDSRYFETYDVKQERLFNLVENVREYQDMNSFSLQKNILFHRIIMREGMDFAGRVRRIIRNILIPESSSLTTFLSWICCLILVRMCHIIYRDGDKKHEIIPFYIELIYMSEGSLFYAIEVSV